MSYLNALRLHFAGQFQASVSTVNNDPTHFNNATFQPSYQQPGTSQSPNGWWNPDGDAAWRLIDCQVTSAFLADGSAVQHNDPIMRSLIADSDRQTTAKLVDLDPEQQLVSQIWGLEVRITDRDGNTLMRGQYEPAAFMDIWPRIQQGAGDITAGAMYQSVLTDLQWADVSASPFLQALKQAAGDGLLSIKFNVDSYNMTLGAARFARGRIVGTIGPASASEPRHFVAGRQLMASSLPTIGFFRPAQQVNFCVAVVDRQRGKIYLDLGNALPIGVSGGPPAPLGDLWLVCATGVGLSRDLVIDVIPQREYTNASWYSRTAGIVELPARRALGQDELNQITTNPLSLWTARDSTPTAHSITQAVVENQSGLYIRADQFVFRLNPGDQASVQLYATCFGQPYPDATVFSFQNGAQLQIQADPTLPVATPTTAISFAGQAITDQRGMATLVITASDPGNPRGYIDGQVYGVWTVLADMLAPIGNTFGTLFNPFNFISVLVWDAFQPADPLTWWGTSDQDSIQSILQQYANLYPVMLDFLNLGDYQSVCSNVDLLRLAFGLDPRDPNSMPVTRDLSQAKRAAILRWLSTPGPDGKPLEGAPRQTTRAAQPEAVPLDGNGRAPISTGNSKEIALSRRLSIPRSSS